MKYIRIGSRGGDNPTLTTLLRTLKEGGVIAVPTDTVYGLIADATSKKGISRIFQIKKRDPKKMLPVFIANHASAQKISVLAMPEISFLNNVWPGALTAVTTLRPNNTIDTRLTARKKDTRTIALRIPKYSLLQTILEHYKKPLAQTSANPTGLPPATSGRQVLKYFAEAKIQPDMVIAGKTKKNATPSTIIDMTETPWKELRKGATTKKLVKILKHYGVHLR